MRWPSKDPDGYYIEPSATARDAPSFRFAVGVTLGCLALLVVIAQVTHRDPVAALALGGAISSAAMHGAWRLRRKRAHNPRT